MRITKMETTISNMRYGTCRFCLGKGEHQDIFKEYYRNGTREVYMDIIMECFNIFLSTNTALNSLVCSLCVQQLRDANSFRLMVMSSEKQLLNSIIDKETVFVNVPESGHGMEVPVSDLSVEVPVNDRSMEVPAGDHGMKIYVAIQSDHEIVVKAEFADEESPRVTDYHSDHIPDGNEDCDITTKDDWLASDDMAEGEAADISTKNDWLASDEIMIEGEAALLARFPASKLKLPTRKSLRQTCPNYFRHLERLKGKKILPRMIAKLLEEADKEPPFLKRGRVYLTEKMAHILNASTILEHSNATPFKTKNRTGFSCFYCRNVFENLEKLKEHHTKSHKKWEIRKILGTYGAECFVVYVDVTDLMCMVCDEQIPTLKLLKTHLMKVHKKKMHLEFTDRVIPFKLSQDNIYVCQICGFSFETFGSIERHMNVHYRNYVCRECGTGFVTKYRLKVHAKSMHFGGSFPCEICKKVYSTQQKQKNHVDAVHKMVKRFKCPKCPERFSEYFRRQKHLVEIHGMAPLNYKCNVCDKSFDRRYTLSRHMKRDHLEERDFQCDLCSYKCFTNNELRVHMVKHNGERIFECAVCKKSYARKKTLKEHMRIHNNDRRFACAVCDEAFVQKCSLKGHIKTHHLEYSMQ